MRRHGGDDDVMMMDTTEQYGKVLIRERLRDAKGGLDMFPLSDESEIRD